MTFDRKTIHSLNAEINQALQAIAQKHGIEIKTGNSSFTRNNFTTKIHVSAISEDGQVMSQEAVNYNRYREVKGFKKNLGDTFIRAGKRYTIIGYKPRSHRYPIVATAPNGKAFKFPIEVVK